MIPPTPAAPAGRAPLPERGAQRNPAEGGTIPDSARVRIGEQGYIHGIDGMLQQVASAFVGEVMPHVSSDRQMQAAVGRAIGQEIARPLWVLAGVAAAAGLIYLVTKAAEQPSPKRGRRPFSAAP